jgi:alkyl sulfatase BDS1-like metallo-beta-lactamase superfamily hydrolase
LSKQWWARGYYGAVSHNVKAIYAHYLGPYDGNPATLNALPPELEGRKYVEYMGGADAVLKRAREDFDRGEFRWVVQVLNNLVFAQPDCVEARLLAADAMEQLGYQSESSTWRNAYLLGALELRQGIPWPKSGRGKTDAWAAIVAKLPMEHVFNFLAIRVNGPNTQDLRARFDWILPDENLRYRLTLSNGALSYRLGSHGASADAVIRTDRSTLSRILSSGTLLEAFHAGELRVSGDSALFSKFLAGLETFDVGFNVIEP